MRVAIYARVSTKDQNCELQLRELRAFCAARGFSVSGEYVDIGESGAKDSRPQLNELMAAARKRQFDAVIVWRFDRFARSTKHLLLALEEFRSLGIQFISYQENIDTSSPLGQALFTIVSAVAQLERDLIRERVSAGIRNVTIETIRAAKHLTRDSRVRMMRFEANASKLLYSMISTLEKLVKDVRESKSTDLASVLETETRHVLAALPALVKQAEAAAAKDSEFSAVDKAVSRFAPTIAKYISGLTSQSNESQVRTAAESVVDSANAALATLDEVECPHCGGRGLIGLVGDFCGFCHGDQVVSQEQAESYDPGELDEDQCPRCHGRGMTGLVGNICAFCKGSCVVSIEEARTYDEGEIDEVLCPHCGGKGTTGLVSDLCSYCAGSCYVSRDEGARYSQENIDEVDCPHCGGRGTQGFSTYLCSFCKGSQTVTRDEAKNYDRAALDEVDCPHCYGRGLTGLNSALCSYCKGARVVSTEEKKAYDKEDIDEVECPRCGGGGMTGLRGTQCGLCKGGCVVSRDVARAFRNSNR